MYEELIQRMNPIANLNLKWYKNEDLYSEGAAEDIVIKLIAENEPENYVDAIFDNYSWSTYYHLSHIRQNILNWYPFSREADVLEIGCGMGAITGMLCDKVGTVTAVELSKRRATATLLRCREKENLEIIVGNLNDIEFEKKFDYITLIGVLEYQGSYTNTDNPYLDFLRKVKSLLKPNGKLLIAIENQYGLKYWCGAREDHTGIPFDGINGYRFSEKKVRTFSRNELEHLVHKSGFKNTFFYYPMPDYKLPTVIYSEKKLPDDSNMQNMRPYYIPDDTTLVADEAHIYQGIVENDVFEFFANSFLVECTDDDITKHITFASMSNLREREYCIGTRFVEKETVEKFTTLCNGNTSHLDNIQKNETHLLNMGINVLVGKRDNNTLIYKYTDEELLEKRIINLLKEGNIDLAISALDKVYRDILQSSTIVDDSENLIFTLGINVPDDKSIYGPVLETGYIDMILRNAFIHDNDLIWFDQEWTLENIPANFVMYRLLKELYFSYPELESYLKMRILSDRYNITEAWKVFEQVEAAFMDVVIDKKLFTESAVYCRKDMKSIIHNIKLLTS